MNFSGKRIVVVGASSGIGECTARVIHEAGGEVILLARRIEKLEEIQESLCRKNVNIEKIDVTNISDIQVVFSKIICDFGKLDGLVYSAGINEDIPLKDLNNERLKKIFDTNFFGFIECVRQVTKKGAYNDNLRIVSVSSVASLLGEKAHTAYAASKAAMDAAVRCMAIELARKGICINSVAPSMIKTAMTEKFLELNGENSEANERTMKRQYLGMGETNDIANAIAFLLSKNSRFITGITLPVDGGFSTSC